MLQRLWNTCQIVNWSNWLKCGRKHVLGPLLHTWRKGDLHIVSVVRHSKCSTKKCRQNRWWEEGWKAANIVIEIKNWPLVPYRDWKEDIGQHLKYMIVDLELTKLKISQLLVFNKRNFISFAIEMYRCLHFYFYSFFIACAQTIITNYQWFFLVFSILISYYQQHVFMALQCAQMIFQQPTTLGRGSSSLSHIIPSAPLSLINLIDNTSVLSLLCYHWLSFCNHKSSLHSVFTWFCWLFAFVFLWVVFTCVLALYFWWMGSHPWFFTYKVFPFFYQKIK